MQQTIEQAVARVAAYEKETRIYKEKAEKYMDEFNRVSQEYYEFRQNNIQADTRLRDMKIELKAEKEKTQHLTLNLEKE